MSLGRQTRDGVAVQRVQVMLDEITIERAKALGKGNLSIGLRTLAKEGPDKARRRSMTAKEIWDAAQSTAFNHATREYFARLGGFGAVIPEGPDGEPDFARGEVSPLSEWSCQDF